MAKRGYKLQEFVAHSANVNCIKIGKKTRRHFITGGDDEIVNLWSIGKSTSITSLSGHTSPIESVAFDSTEVLVAAGASSGVVKLWDLEETKVVRTLNGHRSYCTAVEFHPFGEFFASGSMDTNLKIWDIRIKGCIHTYKGHKRAISSIKFTPDGRWVVSGGLDNVVKIWDLTAGKLLHEFKSHEGHIRSMDFHPLEFLLATGSSDKTVKFWDLESFELIGSTQPEATGVRSVTFHPDGRTLFCGLDNSLKVYSWEPVICHDTVDLRWSTLGDLCIDDGKLLGCSYNQNSIGIWAADVSQIEPYVNSISMKDKTPKSETKRRSFIPPDDDTKDIKNIYVDSMTLNLTNTKETDIQKPHRLKPPSTKIDTENISKSVESVLKCGSDVVSCAQPVTKTSEIQLKTPDSVSIETKTSQILLKTCDLTPKPSRNIVREKIRVSPIQSSIGSRRVIPEKVKSSRMLVERRSKSSSQTARTSSQRHDTSAHMTTEKTNFSPLLVDSPQTTGRCTKSNNDDDLMLDHEFFTINLRSRLTKLQMVRHFWEQNDMRGAIIVLQKLPDHAVQADVISVMLENIESLTLDLFSCLLPLLLGLLDSDTERHVNVSLEMLLKLVAVFWPVITSTISGPSAVGVNLQAETRYECCSQCHVQLQKIHKSLPNVIRRGGLTARSAQELNLILEQS